MLKTKLSNHEVDISTESLTWAQAEILRSYTLNGLIFLDDNKKEVDPEKMFLAKLKRLEMAVKKIVDKEGKEVPFSRAWVETLSRADGKILYDAINAVDEKKEVGSPEAK